LIRFVEASGIGFSVMEWLGRPALDAGAARMVGAVFFAPSFGRLFGIYGHARR